MKYTLRQASSDCCFYEMIQEAYFQCGIILRNKICRDYFDYERFFIHRRSNFYWKEFGYLDKKTIACMVHLLLIKRKNLPDGVGWLLDCIERMICNTMENPFEKLLAQGKYKHEIDFGVRAESLNNPIWEKVNWYDLGVEDDCTIDDIERGWVTPDDYCEHLTNSIDEIMKSLDLQDKDEELEALNRISKWLYDDRDCTNKKCEFYDKRPNKCTCDENYLVLEPPYFNPLKKKVIDKMKQAVMDKFAKTSKQIVPSENKDNSPIRLKDGVEIAEIERIIFALCKMNYFEVIGKEVKSPDKDVFKAFGDFLGLDLSNYHNNIKLKSTSLEKQLDIFTKMEEVIRREWKKKNEQ